MAQPSHGLDLCRPLPYARVLPSGPTRFANRYIFASLQWARGSRRYVSTPKLMGFALRWPVPD